MKVAIDTSSLITLARYYLPFDNESILINFFKNKIEAGKIIVIDKVHEECKYNAKGLVLKAFPFLDDKEFKRTVGIPFKTDTILAPNPIKFLNLVDNNWVQPAMRKKLTDIQYDSQKTRFLDGADMKLVLTCLNLVRPGVHGDIYLVTEETEHSNDDKLYKKLPVICADLKIQTLTIPQLLEKFNIGLDFTTKN